MSTLIEKCKSEGSIQKLVANKWKTVGIGHLSLFNNRYNPTKVLIKLLRTKRNEIHIFQCNPKNKTHGKSLIIKGTETKKNQEFILAIRFKQDTAMQQFQTYLDNLYRRNKSVSIAIKPSPAPSQELWLKLIQVL